MVLERKWMRKALWGVAVGATLWLTAAPGALAGGGIEPGGSGPGSGSLATSGPTVDAVIFYDGRMGSTPTLMVAGRCNDADFHQTWIEGDGQGVTVAWNYGDDLPIVQAYPEYDSAGNTVVGGLAGQAFRAPNDCQVNKSNLYEPQTMVVDTVDAMEIYAPNYFVARVSLLYLVQH